MPRKNPAPTIGDRIIAQLIQNASDYKTLMRIVGCSHGTVRTTIGRLRAKGYDIHHVDGLYHLEGNAE